MSTITDRTLDPDFLKQAGENYQKDGVSGPRGHTGPQGIQYAGAGLNWTPPFYFEELRDKLAMAALTALIPTYDLSVGWCEDHIADAAYKYADAMMKVRETKPG